MKDFLANIAIGFAISVTAWSYLWLTAVLMGRNHEIIALTLAFGPMVLLITYIVFKCRQEDKERRGAK